MQFTNVDTFKKDNSLLLVGATCTGKSVLQEKLIDNIVKTSSPKEVQFILLDMTNIDYLDLRQNHKDYIQKYIGSKPEAALNILDEMAELAEKRSHESITQPLLFICIEECDMAAVDQPRFDNAVMKINKNAKAANMKLIYSTSRPGKDAISKKLLQSFDLILAGILASNDDRKYVGLADTIDQEPYSFVVIEKER